ncbi:MerR family transcriptional regulator [Andreprevotia chitinilytica]|uniref:MerR family transcriptional regulator n=1 Tax=Andreprevotia chitinilytica TaxID=396808 RepID=UPI0005579605|nr:MerR family transcriptional regulator [Andreprevotia chitinilytica]
MMLSIREVAALTGLTPHTLRYYESIGLIDPILRRSGQRQYRDADLRWLEFLLRLKATGMGIVDMQRYAMWRREGATAESLANRQALMETHADAVEAEIAQLQQHLALLRDKIAYYREQSAALEASCSLQPAVSGAHDVEHEQQHNLSIRPGSAA